MFDPPPATQIISGSAVGSDGLYRSLKAPGGESTPHLLKDARVVALHLGLEAGRRFEVGQLSRVPADVT